MNWVNTIQKPCYLARLKKKLIDLEICSFDEV